MVTSRSRARSGSGPHSRSCCRERHRCELVLSSQPRAEGTETIIVVEDEPAVLRSTARILRDAGYTIVEAVNGMAARHAIASGSKIDLVLTDVMMPKMGGKELAEHLANDRPGLKILFMTGYSNDAAINESADRHVLFKPFRSSELLAKIREVLDTVKIVAAA